MLIKTAETLQSSWLSVCTAIRVWHLDPRIRSSQPGHLHPDPRKFPSRSNVASVQHPLVEAETPPRGGSRDSRISRGFEMPDDPGPSPESRLSGIGIR